VKIMNDVGAIAMPVANISFGREHVKDRGQTKALAYG